MIAGQVQLKLGMKDTLSRDAAVLLENFLENTFVKAKSKMLKKLGGKLEKWAPRNGNLALFCIKKIEIF